MTYLLNELDVDDDDTVPGQRSRSIYNAHPWMIVSRTAFIGFLLFVRCACRDGIILHIDDIQGVVGQISKYGFVQQLSVFVLQKPNRTPTTGDIGKRNTFVIIYRLLLPILC